MYRPNLALFLRTSLPLLAASALITACGDNGGTEPEPEGGMGGELNVRACDRDADCDDSFYCNGEEKCVDNLCRQGDRVDCSDGIDCTVDRCVEDKQECTSEAPDEDGDGHLDASCENADGESFGDDCDDDDSLSYPGNTEVCDQENRDEDCDPKTFGTLDSDRDSYIDAMCCNADEDGDLNCGNDCDDKKTNVNPAATEACDFLDNNCDDETDEGVSINMYEDKDHDGHGDDEVGTVKSCAGAVGYAVIDGDCDDDDPEVFLGQFEICDDKDNNCDGQADEVRELAPWYKDTDSDGYGDPESTPVLSCYRIPGRVLSQNDCNDGAKTVNPNATEICDGQDNDCSGRADFKLAGNNNFEDDDEDGAADADCGGSDCNDSDSRTSEGAQEVCDRIDNDCDGEVDEQTVQNIWYIDEDGDGWGVVIGSALASCDPIAERASQFGDCDDTKRDVKPGTAEMCDGVDQDCDGIIDEGAGVHCDLPNALNTCRFGECGVFSCLPGFVDLNGTPADGCEAAANPADYATNTACTYDAYCNDANLCNGIETCAEGFCRLGTPIACGAGPSVVQGNFVISDGRDILDLEGIELITGDLIITSTLLSSLVGLESLRVIGGNLYIQGNSNLVRLSGSALSHLEVVGGDIVISDNPKLTSASLPGLVSANELNISNNDALVDLKGFQNLANVDRILHISENNSLKTISEFDSLGRIGGAFESESTCYGGGGLEVQYNYSLQSMDAFSALEQVEGDLCVYYNYQVADLTFENLETVGKSMRIEGADSLEAFEAPVLSSVGSNLAFGGGEGGGLLKAISLPSLVHVGAQISYYGSGATLEEISFPVLAEVGDISFNIYSSSSQLGEVDFSSLETAESISFIYTATDTGVPVWEFPELVSVTGGIYLTLNAQVTAVRAPLLQTAGLLSIAVESDVMQSFDFASLVEVYGNLNLTRSSVDPNATPLNNVDFGSLVKVGVENDSGASAYFSLPTTSLDIGQLTTAGNNNGSIYLYVAPFNVCADVARIFAGAFVGNIYEDVGCVQN
jgi:Putative metal-binding motif/Receptor L domain